MDAPLDPKSMLMSHQRKRELLNDQHVPRNEK